MNDLLRRGVSQDVVAQGAGTVIEVADRGLEDLAQVEAWLSRHGGK